MLSGEPSENRWAADMTATSPNSSMCSRSPMNGLFDIDVYKHEPPDLLDFDLDLLSPPNSQVSAIDDIFNPTEPIMNTVLENWQMNEAFQDIQTLLDAVDVDVMPNSNSSAEEVDDIIQQLSNDDTSLLSPLIVNICDQDQKLIEEPTVFDLGTIIKECFEPQDFVGYSLLEELETLHTEKAAEEKIEDICTIAVNTDHSYTQLSSIKLKPNETRKQAIRRIKNNAASKVCRRQRKSRFKENSTRVEELMMRNAELQNDLITIQGVVEILKDHLVKATTKKLSN